MAEGLMEEVIALVERHIPVSHAAWRGSVLADTRLIPELGFDSLRVVELALACELRFGARLEVTRIVAMDPTPARLAAMIGAEIEAAEGAAS